MYFFTLGFWDLCLTLNIVWRLKMFHALNNHDLRWIFFFLQKRVNFIKFKLQQIVEIQIPIISLNFYTQKKIMKIQPKKSLKTKNLCMEQRN